MKKDETWVSEEKIQPTGQNNLKVKVEWNKMIYLVSSQWPRGCEEVHKIHAVT